MKGWVAHRYDRWAVLVLLVGVSLRGAIAAFLPPGFDEAYYYLYTQHLDWSYFDHPVLVALSTGVGVWLTGIVSQFTIRWGALLLHTGALGLLYLTGRHLFSAKAGWLTLAIASLAPIFLVGFGVMTLPDAPLVFFWSATLYVASREFFPQPERTGFTYRPTWRVALLGLLVGLACLGKYHGAALGFGLVGFCLTQPTYRKVLVSPWLVLGAVLFGVAIAPILIWNHQHDWVSLRFQSGRAVPDRGYSLVDLLVTWLVGIAYLFPSFGFLFWWVSGKAVWLQFPQLQSRLANRRNIPFSPPVAALILWLSLPLMLGFTLMGGYRQILPTWAAPGFWGMTLLLGAWVSTWRTLVWRRWLMVSAAIIVPILLLAVLHLSLGIFQKPGQYAIAGGFLTPANDASTQQINIQQLRQQFAESGVLSQGDFLFTNDIYLAGQLGMAIAPLTRQPITCFDPDPRGFAFWSTAEEWVGQRGLLVTTPAQAAAAIAQYQGYFSDLQLAADLPIRRGGEVVRVVQVYRAGVLQIPYPRPYGRMR